MRYSVIMLIAICIALTFEIASTVPSRNQEQKYMPTWDSLDKRPLPAWFDEAKIGIFIHWGVFSVPSFESTWFWYYWKVLKHPGDVQFMKKNYKPGFTYADFAAQFTAEFYNPDQWADLFKAAGAKYVVLTSKHHEGFCNWKTDVSFNWNSVDVGPKRDLVRDLAASIRNRTDLRFGLYHSLYEWFNQKYDADKASGFKTQNFVKEKTIPELHEIVNNYKPEVIWSDGDWEASPEYWTSQEFLAWLYNDSPVKDTVVTNDRWGTGTNGKHGGYYNVADRYNPRKLLSHKWENAMTIDKKAWLYRREAVLAEFLTIEQILDQLISTISCGGNLLIDVGPTVDGRITPIFEERLRQMGTWLGINGEAIYKSKPWLHQNDTVTKNVWYTTGNNAVYAMTLQWPAEGKLFLGAIRATSNTKMSLLGSNGPLTFTAAFNGVTVQLPLETTLKWAWTIKIINVNSDLAMNIPMLDIL